MKRSKRLGKTTFRRCNKIAVLIAQASAVPGFGEPRHCPETATGRDGASKAGTTRAAARSGRQKRPAATRGDPATNSSQAASAPPRRRFTAVLRPLRPEIRTDWRLATAGAARAAGRAARACRGEPGRAWWKADMRPGTKGHAGQGGDADGVSAMFAGTTCATVFDLRVCASRWDRRDSVSRWPAGAPRHRWRRCELRLVGHRTRRLSDQAAQVSGGRWQVAGCRQQPLFSRAVRPVRRPDGSTHRPPSPCPRPPDRLARRRSRAAVAPPAAHSPSRRWRPGRRACVGRPARPE
ncbi:hypothetical protein SAMN05216551_10566 [Chitinasiproducens palmae]|uniref:Uncharacterized protein n=1 Tax=Chitinasiproducens palmae TaxID=1770053 RepID=A0A1H2PQW2_9BURK|nr:hypothetical protein SAMN05216551_10566 [Chitinasiproducens palmae]